MQSPIHYLATSIGRLVRVAGIEPAGSAWKAEVLPLNNTRNGRKRILGPIPRPDPPMVEGVGFEPTKAEPSDLQSDPFDRSGTPPIRAILGGGIFYIWTGFVKSKPPPRGLSWRFKTPRQAHAHADKPQSHWFRNNNPARCGVLEAREHQRRQ